jgi:hypothetical protein
MIKEKLTDYVIVGGKSVLMTDVFETLKKLCDELNLSITNSLDKCCSLEGFGLKSKEIFINFKDIKDNYIWVPMAYDDQEMDIIIIKDCGDDEEVIRLDNFKDEINIFIKNKEYHKND